MPNVLSVGPVRINAFAGIDVDFADADDLQYIQYRIGASGAWTNLTTDGINQRVALVDELLAATTDPAAVQALQQARQSLTRRAARLSPQPAPAPGNGN